MSSQHEQRIIRILLDVWKVSKEIKDILLRIDMAINRQLPSITEQPCKCECGWKGTVWDCEPDIDGEGSLGCPKCKEVIEAYAE